MDPTKAEPQSVPDLNANLRFYEVGAVHSSDFARLTVPLDILNVLYHGQYILLSLRILEELHSVDQQAGAHWHKERLHVTSQRKTFETLEDRDGVKLYPGVDFDSNLGGDYGVHGKLADQRAYVRTEIANTRSELEIALTGLTNVLKQFSHIPISPDASGRVRHDFLGSLDGLTSHLATLDLATFKAQNVGAQNLLYDEIHHIVSQPNFIFPNDSTKAKFHNLAKCPLDDPDHQTLLHLHSHFSPQLSTIRYKPWTGVTPPTRKKRQIAAFFGASLVGSLFSNFISYCGFGHSSYCTKQEAGELLHSLEENQDSIFKLTHATETLQLIDTHLVSRQKAIFKHLKKISSKMFLLSLASDFRNDMGMINPVISIIKERISTIISGINQASQGRFPISLISLDSLRDSVKKLYEESGKMGFERITEDLRVLLVSQTKAILLDGKISFLIQIPLKKIGEDLPRLIQIPKGQQLTQNLISYKLQLKNDYFQVKMDKSLYSALPNNVFDKCVIFDEQVKTEVERSTLRKDSNKESIFFCPENRYGFAIERNVFRLFGKTHCLSAIFSKNNQNVIKFCPFLIRPLTQEIVTPLPDNHYVISSPKSIKTRVYCYTNSYHTAKKYYLTNTFKSDMLNIHLRPNCYLVSNFHQITGELSPGSGLVTIAPTIIEFNELEFFRTIRYVMQNSLRSHNDFYQQTKLLANSSEYNDDLSKLREMSTNLREIKKASSKKLPRFNEYPGYRMAESIVTVLACILMSALLIFFIWKILPNLLERGKERVWRKASSGLARVKCCGRNDDEAQPETHEEVAGAHRAVTQAIPTNDCPACEAKWANLSLAMKNMHADLQTLKSEMRELQSRRATLDALAIE